jgi:formamidopyrimidine-DNA glycosylase
LAVVKAQHDENVFGKVGTSAAEFEKHMKGKKIVGAGQQGKYFWITMSTPPHPVLHFGMAGWFHVRGENTFKTKKPSVEDWPPKYWKFTLETKPEKNLPKAEAAFVDFRRFARIRLVDCPADELRDTSPLKENGPDPVVDKDVVTEEWLHDKCKSKKIPIKALLLDQANISGIGNWVGDEILYHARIHPEQYCNTLSDAQIRELHKQLHYVCGLSCEVLAESDKFPEHWLFKHRWGKGKKDAPNKLPNGEKIVFITVGGRTSAVVPSVQRKTGAVAGDVKKEDLSSSEEVRPKGRKKRAVKQESDEDVKEQPKAAPKRKRNVKNEDTEVSASEADEAENEEEQIKPKRAKAAAKATSDKPTANGTAKTTSKKKVAPKKSVEGNTSASAKNATAKGVKEEANDTGRRRSGRLSRG